MKFYKILIVLFVILSTSGVSYAGNPIIPNQGVNDPHIRIFDGKAYLYATHDKSAQNTTFIMEDWWVWSSVDLVNWTKESVLEPKDTYIGKDFKSAWATDVAEKDGKYYWYFSEANEQTGVVVADSPIGPWVDPLGKPLLTSEMTPTHEYDPGILKDGNEYYIVFGAFNYHIAKLANDLISLSEAPRPIKVSEARGPYTNDTEGPFAGKKTDDKPFLHKRGHIYYLSWGAFYATADNPYGPYEYKGELFNDESFRDGTESPTWPQGYLQGRHGSFFDMHGQSYFAYCDISQTGNRYFRDTFISYVHYRDDGTIAPIRVDLTGVGEYNVDKGVIEAEDFFKNEGFKKVELKAGGFGVAQEAKVAELVFPNIRGLKGKTELRAEFEDPISYEANLEVLKVNPDGSMHVIGPLEPEKSSWWKRLLGHSTKIAKVQLKNLNDSENIVIRGTLKTNENIPALDSFVFE
ncbi:MAG: hypothetical protein EX271_13120 [Acidimicrobiales bacterium]|nr:family 43 glycosylhydrolase [Hyphomonadaceae bacterium]RZV35118.1 MAG: hypothetical protein EX271_13120 [Acidimicrobiales bacterium]